MVYDNFEIFPSLKEIKESLLQAFEQHIKKTVVSPSMIETLDDEER